MSINSVIIGALYVDALTKIYTGPVGSIIYTLVRKVEKTKKMPIQRVAK